MICKIQAYIFLVFIFLCPKNIFPQPGGIELQYLSTYETGIFDQGAAEISAYDPITERVFFINGGTEALDIINISNPANPQFVQSISFVSYNGSPNGVAAMNGIVVVALEDVNRQNNGRALFFDTNGTYLNQVTVGALPDMITFTPDGLKVLTANEGEPNDDYTIDPVGSVSIIDLSGGVSGLTQSDVQNVDFTVLNVVTLDSSIRIFGPNATVAKDLEPEYIAVSTDSKTAWVTCQENNAILIVDINSATVIDIKGLGFKNHTLAGNGLDASNQDNAINITNWPVKGMFLPDAISSFEYNGATYLVTANEGDVREYGAFNEADRIGDFQLDTIAFPNYAVLQSDENLGRFYATSTLGDSNNDGFYEELYSFGTRSFTIWDSTGALIYDSGDDFEQITSSIYPANFNANNTSNSFDNRSDDKGPEPEATLIIELQDSIYALIGLERIGGIMVYSITNPINPRFIQYLNNRDFNGNPSSGTAKDLGVEQMTFIPASQSPNNEHLLITANEVSGTISIFKVIETIVPVELTSFTASVIEERVVLNWITATELNNQGFEIQRNQKSGDISQEWEKIGYVPGYGTTTDPKSYSFADENVSSGTYAYRLKQIDFDGTFEYLDEVTVEVSAPGRFTLEQNYPNPFNPTTTIKYSLPEDGFVTLRVYNSIGEEIAELVNREVKAGTYEVKFDASSMSSGIYFYKFRSANFAETKKMLLLK